MAESKAEPWRVPKEWSNNDYWPSEIPSSKNPEALRAYRKSAENFPAGSMRDEILAEVDRRLQGATEDDNTVRTVK